MLVDIKKMWVYRDNVGRKKEGQTQRWCLNDSQVPKIGVMETCMGLAGRRVDR